MATLEDNRLKGRCDLPKLTNYDRPPLWTLAAQQLGGWLWLEGWSSAGAVPGDGNTSEPMSAGWVPLVCEDRYLPVWYHLCVSS